MLLGARTAALSGGGASGEYGGLKFTANTAGSTVAMQAVGSAPSVTLLTSTDGVNWSEFTVGTTTITLANAGDYVYFKAGASGNTGMGASSSNYNKFVLTGSVAASGNTQSLLDASLESVSVGSHCYRNMFYGCTSLTTAPSLPATTLAMHCYRQMFRDCTSLTTAPSLPATTLALYCYSYMFDGCTSLKISANGGVGFIILDIPSGTTSPTYWNDRTFYNTGGTFTGSPSIGVPYYCYS